MAKKKKISTSEGENILFQDKYPIEHLVNMENAAFREDYLQSIGGHDPKTGRHFRPRNYGRRDAYDRAYKQVTKGMSKEMIKKLREKMAEIRKKTDRARLDPTYEY